MDLYDVAYYAFRAFPFIYFIFFLWLVWAKASWSKKIKIVVTAAIVVMAIGLCLGLYFYEPFSDYGGCQDLVPLGE